MEAILTQHDQTMKNVSQFNDQHDCAMNSMRDNETRGKKQKSFVS